MTAMAVGEKRIIDDSLQKAQNVLVDVEGTTTSITFLKDTLFPYVRENLQSYLKSHWDDAELQADLALLKKQAKQDLADQVEGVIDIPEENGDGTIEAVVKNVLWQMDMDRKTEALKKLQAHIMRDGYKNGKIRGHVYSDVVSALKLWTDSGRQVYVYSTGSVESQKLLFGHSEEGNLLELFSGHFDSEVGPQTESESYSKIVKKLNCSSSDIVFLTDVPNEAKAAQDAGLNAVLVVREGNSPLTEEDRVKFPVIKSFHDFMFEASAKRKKMSPEAREDACNGTVNDADVEKTKTEQDVEMMEVSSETEKQKIEIDNINTNADMSVDEAVVEKNLESTTEKNAESGANSADSYIGAVKDNKPSEADNADIVRKAKEEGKSVVDGEVEASQKHSAVDSEKGTPEKGKDATADQEKEPLKEQKKENNLDKAAEEIKKEEKEEISNSEIEKEKTDEAAKEEKEEISNSEIEKEKTNGAAVENKNERKIESSDSKKIKSDPKIDITEVVESSKSEKDEEKTKVCQEEASTIDSPKESTETEAKTKVSEITNTMEISSTDEEKDTAEVETKTEEANTMKEEKKVTKSDESETKMEETNTIKEEKKVTKSDESEAKVESTAISQEMEEPGALKATESEKMETESEKTEEIVNEGTKVLESEKMETETDITEQTDADAMKESKTGLDKMDTETGKSENVEIETNKMEQQSDAVKDNTKVTETDKMETETDKTKEKDEAVEENKTRESSAMETETEVAATSNKTVEKPIIVKEDENAKESNTNNPETNDATPTDKTEKDSGAIDEVKDVAAKTESECKMESEEIQNSTESQDKNEKDAARETEAEVNGDTKEQVPSSETNAKTDKTTEETQVKEREIEVPEEKKEAAASKVNETESKENGIESPIQNGKAEENAAAVDTKNTEETKENTTAKKTPLDGAGDSNKTEIAAETS